MTAIKMQKIASIGIRIHVLLSGYVKWRSILKYSIMIQSSQSTSGEAEVEGRGQRAGAGRSLPFKFSLFSNPTEKMIGTRSE